MVRKTTKLQTDEKDEERLTPPAPIKDEEKLTPPSKKEVKAKEDKDYLRQYEYNRETGLQYYLLVDRPNVKYMPPQAGSKASSMKAQLLGQDKVKVFIPRGQGESRFVLQSVNINGYRLDFPKNTYIDLPEQVAQNLMDSLKQTED